MKWLRAWFLVLTLFVSSMALGCYKDGNRALQESNFGLAASIYLRGAKSDPECAIRAIRLYMNKLISGDFFTPQTQEYLFLSPQESEENRKKRFFIKGFAYLFGLGRPANVQHAQYWLEASAELGYSKAFTWLGYMAEYGLGEGENLPRAAALYQKGGAAGDWDGSVYLGLLHAWNQIEGANGSAALEVFERLEDRFPPARAAAGYCYLHGIGTQRNLALALDRFETAAAYGNSFAFYHLGKMYLEGTGVRVDIDLAKWLLNLAARMANLDAAKFLKERPDLVLINFDEILKMKLSRSKHLNPRYSGLWDFVPHGLRGYEFSSGIERAQPVTKAAPTVQGSLRSYDSYRTYYPPRYSHHRDGYDLGGYRKH